MTTLSIDANTIQQELNSVAAELQAYYVQKNGTTYTTEDLTKVLTNWLELSIEALVEDAMFHVVEGDRSYAFNRHAFEHEMERIVPVADSSAFSAGSVAHDNTALDKTNDTDAAAA